jgi:hypothetical protein
VTPIGEAVRQILESRAGNERSSRESILYRCSNFAELDAGSKVHRSKILDIAVWSDIILDFDKADPIPQDAEPWARTQ